MGEGRFTEVKRVFGVPVFSILIRWTKK
jgi:hypothetical protein